MQKLLKAQGQRIWSVYTAVCIDGVLLYFVAHYLISSRPHYPEGAKPCDTGKLIPAHNSIKELACNYVTFNSNPQ